jgi:hypothetical protein
MSTNIRTLKDNEGNVFYPLTTSAAVADSLILDLSDVTSGATYSTLSAALSAVPEVYRKGGMELRYINSDGVYEQYRYTGTATTGNPNPFMNTANWQGVDVIENKGALATGTDLNTITGNVIYLLGGSSTYTNKPEYEGAATLQVSTFENVIVQDIHTFGKVWYRRYSTDAGSTWSAWS